MILLENLVVLLVREAILVDEGLLDNGISLSNVL